MKKLSWTAEEKEQILKEGELAGVLITLRKHNISRATYYSWLSRYKSDGLSGLSPKGRMKTVDLYSLQKELDRCKKQLLNLEEELEVSKELLEQFSISDIPIERQIDIVRRFSKGGMKLNLLWDLCCLTKRQYYENLK